MPTSYRCCIPCNLPNIVQRTKKSTGTGFQFTDPYLYDWLGFAGEPLAVQCADEFNWSGVCSDLKICVMSNSTHAETLRNIFPPTILIPKVDSSALPHGLVESECNVLAGEQYDLSEVLVREFGYTGNYENGKRKLAKEPLGERADLILLPIPSL
jgi:hypothetical protein